MLAVASLDGFAFASEYFADQYQALYWLLRQRQIRGSELTYRIESLDGYVLHTL
jgi:IS1 family transposase